MSPFLADVVGIIGSTLIVAAYAYNNMAGKTDMLLYNIINLAGAGLLTASLLVHFNLASFLLEIVWSLIAIFGIFQALKARRSI